MQGGLTDLFFVDFRKENEQKVCVQATPNGLPNALHCSVPGRGIMGASLPSLIGQVKSMVESYGRNSLYKVVDAKRAVIGRC